jgi:2'-hydroxyisoflavone reductase
MSRPGGRVRAVRILILGGTSFVGRAIAEDAVRSGAGVTLFGRGQTGTDLFPGLTRLIGDRDTGEYGELRGGRGDAVVDVSGRRPDLGLRRRRSGA